MSFNHFDDKGNAVMVDVSGKEPTLRTAVATALVRMKPEILEAVLEGRTAKGDVFAVGRLAGIAAAKRTPDMIPLAHPLAIHHAAIEFFPDARTGEVRVESRVKAFERTGVEMEAMISVSIAALTIYDMCKSMDKGITINAVELLSKEGGKSGAWKREER